MVWERVVALFARIGRTSMDQGLVLAAPLIGVASATQSCIVLRWCLRAQMPPPRGELSSRWFRVRLYE